MWDPFPEQEGIVIEMEASLSARVEHLVLDHFLYIRSSSNRPGRKSEPTVYTALLLTFHGSEVGTRRKDHQICCYPPVHIYIPSLPYLPSSHFALHNLLVALLHIIAVLVVLVYKILRSVHGALYSKCCTFVIEVEESDIIVLFSVLIE